MRSSYWHLGWAGWQLGIACWQLGSRRELRWFAVTLLVSICTPGLVCVALASHGHDSATDLKSGGDSESPTAIHEAPPLKSVAFADRWKAMQMLWRDREANRDLILRALREGTPEEVSRARWVMDRWRRGITVDTPRHLVSILSRQTPSQAFPTLMEDGCFDAARIVLDEAIGTLSHDALLDEAATLIRRRFPAYATMATETRQHARFAKVLDRVCVTPEMAVCRLQWRTAMGEDLPVEHWLPPVTDDWPAPQKIETQVMLALIQGQEGLALQWASQSEHASEERIEQRSGDGAEDELDPLEETVSIRDLTTVASFVVGDFESVMDATGSRIQEIMDALFGVDTDQPKSVASWRLRERLVLLCLDHLIARDQLALLDESNEAYVALSRLSHDAVWEQSSDEDVVTRRDANELAARVLRERVASLLWRTFAIHGYVEDALAFLTRVDRASAAELALAASQPFLAFELRDRPYDAIDTQMDAWLTDAIEAQARMPRADQTRGRAVAEIHEMLTLMTWLLRVGRDDAAHIIAKRLSQPDVVTGPYRIREYVVMRLVEADRLDLALLYGVDQADRSVSSHTRRTIAEALRVSDHRVLLALEEFLSSRLEASDVAESFRLAVELCNGEYSKRLSALADSESAFWRLLAESQSRSLQDQDQERAGQRQKVPPGQWGLLLDANGQHELAQPFHEEEAARGDVKSMIRLARRKDTSLGGTKELFLRAWERYRAGRSVSDDDIDELALDESESGIEALMGLWQEAKLLGESEYRERLAEQIEWVACTPSIDDRLTLAGSLMEQGDRQLGDDQFRQLMVMTAFSSRERGSLMDVAREWYRSMPDTLDGRRAEGASEVLSVYQLAFAGTLPLSSYRVRTYLDLPQYYHRQRVQLALESEFPDEQAVKRQLDWIHRFDPIDISLAETVVPLVRTQLGNDVAERHLNRVVGEGRRYLAQFPRDPMVANNLAWCCALNDRHLDEAIAWSRNAVRWEPDSAIYRDTLAELLARTGRFDEALQLERACVLDDPGQWHLHVQIKRFEQSLRATVSENASLE